MKTTFILLAQYDGMAIVPLDIVCRDYFRHLTVEKLLRKTLSGEIPLPITRMEGSQKAARGVHINDLADYLDRQADAARKECAQLASGSTPAPRQVAHSEPAPRPYRPREPISPERLERRARVAALLFGHKTSDGKCWRVSAGGRARRRSGPRGDEAFGRRIRAGGTNVGKCELEN
jgi:hypothetical protein